jgi:hypothetical protein
VIRTLRMCLGSHRCRRTFTSPRSQTVHHWYSTRSTSFYTPYIPSDSRGPAQIRLLCAKGVVQPHWDVPESDDVDYGRRRCNGAGDAIYHGQFVYLSLEIVAYSNFSPEKYRSGSDARDTESSRESRRHAESCAKWRYQIWVS